MHRFKNALIYTVTVQAVSKIVDNKEGSILTLTVTTALMTFGASVLAESLGQRVQKDRERVDKEHGARVINPILRSAQFVALNLVAVGINMQSTLIGTYFGRLFDSGVHPILVLGSALIGLVLLWVVGVVVRAVP